ncbi:MAG: hypothetical protein M1815_002077 [Lichina confinis]|nr:MAG: hypothetical protein M1815_002077 [Lichina confinis]
MSGAGEDRWRMQCGPQPASGARPQRGAGPNPPSSGPANWTSVEKGGRKTSASGPAEGRTMPAPRFDAQEAKELLQQGCYSSRLNSPLQPPDRALGLGDPDRATLYKPANGAVTTNKSASPWASKANQMANGLDFFVQLRKGVAALQHPQPGVEHP